MTSVGFARLLRRMAIAGPCALLPVHGHAATTAAAAAPAMHEAGVWDLVFEKGNRRCRLFLRSEPRGGGHVLAMPPACHYAFPSLAAATNWTQGANQHVALHNEAGATILDFGPDGTAALTATNAGGDVYQFMPADPDLQYAVRMARPDGVAETTPAKPAAAAGGGGVVVERLAARGKGPVPHAAAVALAPALPPVTAAEVAGNYAVLRKDRDTGCMVTLEPGGSRARLAPACRDQGIVIFDPSGWQLHGGELVLMAKRGHTTALTRRDARTWANAPASGAPLVLKRL